MRKKFRFKKRVQTSGKRLFDVGDETVRVPYELAGPSWRMKSNPELKPEPPKHQWWPYDPTAPEPLYTPLDADEWQRFKRDFVTEYGGEPVQPTGMTHSEFIKYLTTGIRETGFDTDFAPLKKMLRDLKK